MVSSLAQHLIDTEKIPGVKRILQHKPVSGGDINQAYQLETSNGRFFIKVNHRDEGALFETERKGLDLLASAQVMKVAKPIVHGYWEQFQYLVLEWVYTANATTKTFWETFGTQLAQLHQTSSETFGLDHHNFIGSLHQDNSPRSSWESFFIECRLAPQAQKAHEAGLLSATHMQQLEMLYQELPSLLPAGQPSLLHGDLWSGNFMVHSQEEPVLIDPAVYFGHSEMEMAFTKMFGGFDQQFYNSYQSAWPMAPGFEQRVDIYNLYPALVHVNLFGTGYLPHITSCLSRFV